MRLTLRTLLAYLDDVLGPAQAKEIGEKVTSSSNASELINRIRDVVRRRRLTAPSLSGPGMGIDPNTIAEYLDNTLPPGKVADVEKVCLDSDVHLAEVAASHQILTLVLGEPIEILPETRERMYALVRPAASSLPAAAQREGAAVTPRESRSPTPASSAAAASARGALPGSTPTTATVPDYLRPAQTWRRFLPYAAIVLLIGGWFALLGRSPLATGLFSSRGTDAPGQPNAVPNPQRPADQGQSTPPPVGPVAAANPNTTSAPATKPSEAGPTPAETTIASATPPEKPLPKPPPGSARKPFGERPAVDLPPPSDVDEAEAMAATTAPNPRQVARVDTPKPPTPPPGETAAVEPASPTPPSEKSPAPVAPINPDDDAAEPLPRVGPFGKYMSSEGVLLHYTPNDRQWFLMPRRSLLQTDDRLAVPEPFDAQIDLMGVPARLDVRPATVLKVLPRERSEPVRLELERGRIVLRTRGEATQTVGVGLKVFGDLWRLELSGDNCVCGIEVTLREPFAFEQDFGAQRYFASIYTIGGTVRLTDARQREQVLSALSWMPLTTESATGLESDMLPPVTPLNLGSAPRWLDETSATAVGRQYARIFEKAFSPDAPVEASITGTIEDKRPQLSKLAVECLGLLQVYPALVDILQRTEHEEARKAAIAALRIWLPLAPENRQRLKEELAKRFSPGDAEVVYRLLWGYNEDNARDPIVSQRLIEWMSHEEIAIRELAFYYVYRLTDKKYDYRPNSSPAQRQAAINRWNQHIRGGGLLPAKPR